MTLNKLKIKNLDNNQEFEVLFNPSAYTIEDSSQWQDQPANRRKPELQFTGGARKTLTMELFFDTYEQNADVRIHTGKIAKLLVPTTNQGNQGKRPPKVRLIWGHSDPDTANTSFPFEGVLEKLTQKFTLFNSEGTPVRATLNVTFKEFALPIDELKSNPRRRSYSEKIYTVKAGDTVSGIAQELWKDARKWRRIAQANDMLNPRILTPGQVLKIPEIRD